MTEENDFFEEIVEKIVNPDDVEKPEPEPEPPAPEPEPEPEPPAPEPPAPVMPESEEEEIDMSLLPRMARHMVKASRGVISFEQAMMELKSNSELRKKYENMKRW